MKRTSPDFDSDPELPASKKDKPSGDSKSDSIILSADTVNDKINKTFDFINKLKNTSNVILANYKEKAFDINYDEVVKDGYLTFLQLKRYFRESHLGAENLKDEVSSLYNSEFKNLNDRIYSLDYEKLQKVYKIQEGYTVSALDDFLKNVMSVEEFKKNCTEEYKPTEEDDEHTVNIKMLNFELNQRKELWSQLTELKKKHKEVSEKVSNFNRSLNSLRSRIIDLEKAAKRVGDEISRINEDKLKLC